VEKKKRISSLKKDKREAKHKRIRSSAIPAHWEKSKPIRDESKEYGTFTPGLREPGERS
jgi:hypothetical protein